MTAANGDHIAASVNQRPVFTLLSSTLASTVATLPIWLAGALSVFIAEEFRFGAIELGRSVAVYFGTAGLVAWTAGGLVERLGSRRAILLAVAIAFIAATGIGRFASHWLHIGFWLIFAGMGSSLMLPATNLAIARAVPMRRMALSFGIKQASVPFATFLAGSSIPLLSLQLGWRAPYIMVSWMCVILFLACLRWLPELGPPPKRTRGMTRTDRRTSRQQLDRSVPGSMALLGFAAAFAVMAATAGNAFLVLSLVDLGYAATTAGLLLSIGGLSSVAARIWAGWFADRTIGDNFHRLAGLFLTGAVGAVILFMLRPETPLSYAIVGVVLLFGAGWGWNGIFHYSLIREYPDRPAFATGVTQIGIRFGGVIGPLTFGMLLAQGSPRVAWAGAACCLFAAAAVVLRARSTSRLERTAP